MSSKLKPQLVIIEGKDKGKVIPLREGTLVFGRSKGDVIVQDPRVSRSHVEIHFDASTGKIRYNDLKSLNGTFVNGEAVTNGELKDGDQLQVGDTTFDVHFSVEGGAKAAPLDPEPDIGPKSEQLPPEPPIHAEENLPAVASPTLARTDKEAPPAGQKKPGRRALLSPRVRIAAIVLVLVCSLYFLLPGGSSATFEESLLEVEKQVQDQKLEEATRTAIAVTERFPEDYRGYLVLGELYAQTGKPDLAIATYQKALGLKDVPDSIHLRLVTLYLRLNRTDEANKELVQIDRIIKESVKKFVSMMQDQKKSPEEVVRENPEIKELLVSTAKIFVEFSNLNSGWDEEKTLILAKGLETTIAANEAVGFLLHAQILIRRGEIPKAAGLVAEAAKRVNNDPFAYQFVSDLQFRIGDYDAAAASAQKWEALVPNAPALVALKAKLNAQAAIQESDALVEGAAIVEKMKTVLEELKVAEKFDPNDEWVLEQKALAYIKRYELEDATAVAERWMKLYPQSPKALIVMSYVKFYLNKAEEALPLIQKVIQMGQAGGDSKYVPDAVYLLGRVFAQQNKKEEALKYIQMSCKLGSKEACSDKLIKGLPDSEVATEEDSQRNPQEDTSKGPADPSEEPSP